jgi:predicted RND superfamily exporter protein
MRFSYTAHVAWVERHQRLILSASLLLTLLAALSLTRLRLDMDVLGMLPEGEPAFDDFKSFVADFGQLDELIVLLEGAPRNELGAFADAFAERLARLPIVAAVHARLDPGAIRDGLLGDYLPNYLDRDDYAELAARLTPEGIERQVEGLRAALAAPFDLGAARAVLEDPLGMRRLAARHLAGASGSFGDSSSGYLFSPEGDALIVFVRPRGSGFDVAFSKRLMDAVRAAEREARQSLGANAVEAAYTGSYVYALEDAGTLRADVLRYVLLALLAVLAVFYFGHGNLGILPFVTYPLLSTTLLTFGLSLLLFAELNAVSISFAAILYGLSIDSGIHFHSRLVDERGRREPADLRAAVTATLSGLGRAHLTSSITTTAAFLVLGLSCLGAVRQLGFLTALGMMLTTAHFFVLYPALAFWRAPPVGGALGGRWDLVLERTAHWSARHARPVMIAAVLLAAALLALATRVRLDASLMDLRPAESAAAAVEDDVRRKFGARHGEGAVLVRRESVDSALRDGEEIARRLAEYEKEGLVRSTRSASALLPSAEEQRARLDRYNALPRAQAIEILKRALSRRGFVTKRFEPFFSRFRPPRHDVVGPNDPALAPLAPLLDHHVRLVAGEAVVATYLEPAGETTWQAITERLRHDLPGVEMAVAARALLEGELARVLGEELALFLVLGLLGNLVLLRATLGSAALALAALAPVLLVLIAIFAAMGATGTALDPVNLVVAPLVLGIGVDDAVYILAAARRGTGVPASVRSAGRAIVITSLTTMAGFGFLGLSRYPALATMGLLVALGVFLCLLASIILLPALAARRSEAPPD